MLAEHKLLKFSNAASQVSPCSQRSVACHHGLKGINIIQQYFA